MKWVKERQWKKHFTNNLLYTPEYVDAHRDELLKELVSRKYVMLLYVFKRQLQAIAHCDTYERLSKIQAPTLIIAGNDDSLIDGDNSRILADQISDTQIKLFESARHGFFWERKEETIQTIMKFLASV